MEFNTRFSPGRSEPLLCTEEERRTKSEFADDCDINKIMARYVKTGVLPESSLIAAQQFGDFSDLPDFQAVQDQIVAGTVLFDGLSASVRAQFNNDPAEFFKAVSEGNGQELLAELGLVKKDSSPESVPSLDLSESAGVPPVSDDLASKTPSRSKKGTTDG